MLLYEHCYMEIYFEKQRKTVSQIFSSSSVIGVLCFCSQLIFCALFFSCCMANAANCA